ncbi:hypothetical protein F4777DRAFT_573403 [Nemania sp. FL0916]|nr:hypothetical protein F4777DRAFT_573403 [Nemania sp. FL0916]
MESSTSTVRGRSRTSARKRHTFPGGSSSHLTPSNSLVTEQADQQPSSTPADGLTSPSLSYDVPSPTASRSTRTRARVAEGTLPSSDDLDNKGGRSLRKRARVDYTVDQADEYMSDSGKATPTFTRAVKRRRTEAGFPEVDNDEDGSGIHMKRRSSEQLLPPPSTLRKRNQSRKSTLESPSLIPDQQMEDADVQDTIEVGGHQSEQSDESTLRRTSSHTSSGLSNEDSKLSHMAASFDSVITPRKSQLTSTQNDQAKNGDHHIVEQHKNLDVSPPNALDNVIDSPHPSYLSYEHLTPYISGEFVEWPSTQLDAEAPSGSQQVQQDTGEETVDDQFDDARLGSVKAGTMHEGTPMTEPLMPESTPVDGVMEETPAVSPLPVVTRANSLAADAELSYSQPRLKKPILFKKTRDASDFTALFENFKSMPPEEVWAKLEVVNRSLVAWQNEYNELRKITDDEDNSVRYHQEELAFEHRLKMAISKDPKANPIQKDFVVKGIRAKRPDPEIAYARYQDKLMAINYGFEYDERDSKIGNQDPLGQRTGFGKGRLRDRPKQTAKAAEADDGITGPGKRIRKPVALYDGSEFASRGSTPVPATRRRRRAGHATEEAGEPSAAAPASTDPAPPKKKGKGGRPRKHPLPVPVPVPAPAPAPAPALADPPAAPEEAPQQPVQADGEKPSRKRGRGKISKIEPAEEEAATVMNGLEQATSDKNGMRRTNSKLSDIPPSSFYTSSMQSANGPNDSRPPTASSTATQSTVASNNYKLREKRQKKFSLNPDDDVDLEEPKPKRVRRSKKAPAAEAEETVAPVPIPSSAPVQQPATEPNPAPKPPTKIKLKNYNGHVSASTISAPATNPFSVPSSSNSTPPLLNGTGNGVANGTDPADIKDYNQMTKSEKMSHSMKQRWASGSMSSAVAKRRATLANKKQAVKAAEPGQPPEATPATPQP